MIANFARVLGDDTPGMRAKVLGIFSALIGFNVLLWALTVAASVQYPAVLGFAAMAYGFGLRHAVDADHISAIDNVTRKLMQERKRPATVGLFFSLGHSTVVIVMATLIAAGSAALASNLHGENTELRVVGGLIGTSVSALFLFLIAVMNLAILVAIVRAFHKATGGGTYSEGEIDAYLHQRGGFARIFRGLFKTVDTSWKMYPIGFLFGLGFDTATEVGLLAASGSFAAHRVPFFVVLLLPLLFTAGMSLADTADGVLMLGAYGWAFVKPIRKLYYNLTTTLISVLVALVIGALETLSVVSGQLNLSGGIWDVVGALTTGGQLRQGRGGDRRHLRPELGAVGAHLPHQAIRRHPDDEQLTTRRSCSGDPLGVGAYPRARAACGGGMHWLAFDWCALRQRPRHVVPPRMPASRDAQR